MENIVGQHNLQISQQGLFHGATMTVGWVALQHIAIWSLLFRNRNQISIFIHATAMVAMLILLALGTA